MKKLFFLLFFLYGAIEASAQCTAAFSIVNISGTTITITDLSTGSTFPVAYQIDFGDGMTSTLPNSTHTYAAPGTYQITYTITDGSGCTDSYVQVVTVPSTTQITYFADSVFNACITPWEVSYDLYGFMGQSLSGDSLYCYIQYGDGVDSNFVLSTNGTSFVFHPHHVYYNPGTYYAQIIVTDANGNSDTAVANPVYITATCGNISGTVYFDSNNDCTYNIGEDPGYGIFVALYDTFGILVATAFTDSSGNYSFVEPTGMNYYIVAYPANWYLSHWSVSCPLSDTITNSAPSNGNDFGLLCPGGYDLTGGLSVWGLRPGGSAYVYVTAYNSRCATPSGQITVTLDPLLTPQPSPLYTINGQTVTYTINAGEYYWSFSIPAVVSTAAVINDSACFSFTIDPIAGDSVPVNNTLSQCFQIRNSCDPNEKYVTPGEGLQGFVHPDDQLTYTVVFQNTGTAEALNIYILDTLSEFVNPSSIHVLGASHPMEWTLLEGNILRFYFHDINLPDSTTNEPMSHGFVMYAIDQIPYVPHLSPIYNTADIYFDFNAPVITNTTVNTPDYFLTVNGATEQLAASVFPNPADKFIQVHFESAQAHSLALCDITGKEIVRQKCNDRSCMLPCAELTPGIYYLNIDGGKSIKRVTVIH